MTFAYMTFLKIIVMLCTLIYSTITETFRLNPAFDNFTKICTQPYEYTPTSPEFKKMHLKLYPGDRVIIPYGSISKDEKYFRNANEFLPERMMDRDGISKSAFFPFGSGPRACIGLYRKTEVTL